MSDVFLEARFHEERMATELTRQRAAEEELAHWQQMNMPHVIYRPHVCKDGNKWSALLGPNLAEGVSGWGDTPEDACLDFDKQWRSK
jgi:hypothetical protein